MVNPIFLHVTEEEKQILLQSVESMLSKLEELAENFYFNFIGNNKEISELFKKTNMFKQHNMFMMSLGQIISNVDDANRVKGYLDDLIRLHRGIGVTPAHVPFFIQAFTKTIEGLFIGKDPRLLGAWTKVIQNAMIYFSSQLENL